MNDRQLTYLAILLIILGFVMPDDWGILSMISCFIGGYILGWIYISPHLNRWLNK